jgi:hypothetical protein
MQSIGVQELALTTGGTLSITKGDNVDWYRLTGTVTLASNLQIAVSGNNPANNAIVLVENRGTITLNGNHLGILGKVLPDVIASIPWVAFCIWNGSTWNVNICFDVVDQNGVLAGITLQNGSVDTAQLKDKGVTLAKLSDLTANTIYVTDGAGRMIPITPNIGDNIVRTPTGFVVNQGYQGNVIMGNGYGVDSKRLREMLTVNVSFESGNQGARKIRMGYKGVVRSFSPYVDKAIAATDDATVQMLDNGSSVMGTATLPASSIVGYGVTVSPVVNNTFNDGDILTLQPSKTTAGGSAVVSLTFDRLS